MVHTILHSPLSGEYLVPCGKEVTRSKTGNEKMNTIAGEKLRAGLTGQLVREQKLEKWREQERTTNSTHEKWQPREEGREHMNAHRRGCTGQKVRFRENQKIW